MPKRRRPKPSGSRQARVRPAPMVDAPSPRLDAARSLWNDGRHADSLTMYAEAIRKEPNNVRCYVLAARAYADKYEFDRMKKAHEQLIRRAPRHPRVHHYIAETFDLLRLPARAIQSYERASRLPNAGSNTWMELASLYERAHRLDEAEALIEQAVRAGYNLPFVSLVRGRIQRRQNRLEQAETTIQAIIGRLPEDSAWACQAWGELALIRDQMGNFDGASNAIERCKRIQKLHEAPYFHASEKVHGQMREMIAAITRDDFRRWRDAAQELGAERVALLTGFPRSGTTLLEQVLDAHPDLVSSEERDFMGRELFCEITTSRKTMHLIDVLNDLRVEEIGRNRKRYFRAMEYLLGEQIRGRMHLDKNPAYNLTIPLMLRVFPETRLIIALRDPRDVVLSCYMRYLPLNALSVRFLDVMRTAERYALDMSAWLKFRELIDVPWCEIRYDAAVADLAGEARRALRALELPWDDQVLNYRQRLTSEKQVTSPSYEEVVQPIYSRSIGRWKNYQKLLEPALKTLDPFVREFGYCS
jgi:tetratricopeptide (TPR) repeat protein